MSYIKNTNQGTTIVELLLYSLLLSIFLLALFNIFSQILNARNRSQSITLVQRNGNYLLTRLASDIKDASSVTTPISIGSSATTMSLTIGTTINTYSLSSGRLQINSHNLNDVDTTVSHFIVKKIGNIGGKSTLQIGFTLTSNIVDTSGAPRSQSYFTATTLR
jgi:hypothetical protein